jgi:hypothetical protein
MSIPNFIQIHPAVLKFSHVDRQTYRHNITGFEISILFREISITKYSGTTVDNNDHVNGVSLCLWTAATNRPIVYPLGDT